MKDLSCLPLCQNVSQTCRAPGLYWRGINFFEGRDFERPAEVNPATEPDNRLQLPAPIELQETEKFVRARRGNPEDPNQHLSCRSSETKS